jgi:hypothetical protein
VYTEKERALTCRRHREKRERKERAGERESAGERARRARERESMGVVKSERERERERERNLIGCAKARQQVLRLQVYRDNINLLININALPEQLGALSAWLTCQDELNESGTARAAGGSSAVKTN